MPPIPSDDESDGADVSDIIPARAVNGKSAAVEEPEDTEETGDQSEDEDEYSVDRILEHGFERDGSVKYKVKWLGYENEEDMTWEPLENLETASEKLNEYHESIGGPPVWDPPSKKNKKGKRTAAEALESPAPTSSSKKRGRKNGTNGTASEEKNELLLPKGTWENDVSHVMSIVEESEPDPKKPSKEIKTLMGFLSWNDGRKSKHPLKTLRTKCPQALLTYYENHLRFGP